MSFQMQDTGRLTLMMNREELLYHNAKGSLFISANHKHFGSCGDDPVAVFICGEFLDLLQCFQIEYIYMRNCYNNDSTSNNTHPSTQFVGNANVAHFGVHSQFSNKSGEFVVPYEHLFSDILFISTIHCLENRGVLIPLPLPQ